ncbi:hypothetical protein [Pararhizobium antarcticum]|uniref:Flagellar basal body-associated protein FliL n=1 Tax=Pararhizobium antarcticum TaxID=1798805 RepID=A0A657LRL4_9HYPH|nr:hypothetical protein [Pararhizobium antarcticum]OJF95253.1 hypothetical protein AX761_17975 [Rhizobium sp. 58]OJF95386.1 hypothetical protein AX760_19490 [Pararhizobium antarcticum]
MLKLVFTGVWVCAVSLGSVYASMKYASAPVVTDEEAARRASEEYVTGEMLTVPVITNGAVQGYFLTKLSFSVKKDKIKTLPIPLKQMVTDLLFDILVGDQLINVADTSKFDMVHFKTAVKDGLNAKIRDEVITEVLVENLEYLSKADVARIADSQNQPRQVPVAIKDKDGNVARDVVPGKPSSEAAE